MFATDKGVLYRSRPTTYATGAVSQLDMSFLHNPMQKMRAPVVRELIFHFSGDISGVTATFDNIDGCQIFSQLRIADRAGDIYKLPGKLARMLMQQELGTRADEVDGLADAASGATTSGDDMLIRVPFDLEYAAVGADTALPLVHLVDGGEIEMTFGTPVGSTGVSGTVVVYAVVHDEKRRELKSRLIRRTQAVTARDAHYPLGGSIRSLTLCSNPTATSMSPWTASTYTALNVPELDMSVIKSYLLRNEYARLRPDRSSADVVDAGLAVPLVVPSKGQRIDKMPDLRSIHVDLGSDTIPTSAQLLQEYIEDRDPSLAAQWLGYADTQRFANDLREHGKVNLGRGRSADAASFPAHLARRLPMEVKGA